MSSLLFSIFVNILLIVHNSEIPLLILESFRCPFLCSGLIIANDHWSGYIPIFNILLYMANKSGFIMSLDALYISYTKPSTPAD